MITELEPRVEGICTYLKREGILPISFPKSLPQDEETYGRWAEKNLPNLSFEEKEKLGEKQMRYAGTNDTEEHAARFYDYVHQTGFIDLERSLEYDNLCQQILFIIQNLTDHSKILDIGCGDGLHDIKIAQEYPHSEVEGVDLSSARIKKAKERAKRNNIPNISFTTGNFFNNPETSGNFDTVLAIHTIHEADSPEEYISPYTGFAEGYLYFEAFQRISAHLKPNGKVIIGLPACVEYHERLKDILPWVVKRHKLEVRDPKSNMKSIEYTLEKNKKETKDLFFVAHKIAG